jgi:hypothetical protein
MNAGPKFHLFFIISEEDDDGMHIVVNVTSIDATISYDKTCVLNAGDHEFITHSSYIAYELATEMHKNRIDGNIAKKIFQQKKAATAELISKICEGLKTSPFTKRGVKDAYDRCLRAAAKREKAAAEKAAASTAAKGA